MLIQAPQTEQQLLQRAYALAGQSLAQLAKQAHLEIPVNLQRAKGWVGQLLEYCLGADAGNQALPDFLNLGIELKTIPIDISGKPMESTYVCTVPMLSNQHLLWPESVVYKKLQKVLWIPVQADKSIALGKRKVGMPLLWQPNTEQNRLLQQDWEELMELVALGQAATISGRLGQILQIRPKAANSRVTCLGTNAAGQIVKTLPRGFYLRASFTKQLLAEYYSI